MNKKKSLALKKLEDERIIKETVGYYVIRESIVSKGVKYTYLLSSNDIPKIINIKYGKKYKKVNTYLSPLREYKCVWISTNNISIILTLLNDRNKNITIDFDLDQFKKSFMSPSDIRDMKLDKILNPIDFLLKYGIEIRK